MKLHHSEPQNLKIPPTPFRKGEVSGGFARAAPACAPRDARSFFIKIENKPSLPRLRDGTSIFRYYGVLRAPNAASQLT